LQISFAGKESRHYIEYSATHLLDRCWA